ncbi:DNA starvation/stationary phase protection protein [Paenibacillus sp. CC-CFT747]|nr:DNA starvation/stationary phase protection protein [Paenibacillus sp. CC-CFT747]
MATTTKTKNSAVVEVLNKQVANWSVMFIKLHNYHWYITGENFFTLHVKLEELYNEASVHLDEIAERILALRGKPVATMKECLSLSSVKEATGKEDATQMVAQVVEDFELISTELHEGIEVAEEAKDSRTADMLTQIQTSLEKHSWMLAAFLGEKPNPPIE